MSSPNKAKMDNLNTDNTLNIQPIIPGSVPNWDAPIQSSDNQVAAEAARSKIEQLHHPVYQGAAPTQMSRSAVVSAYPTPVSPAQQQAQHIPQIPKLKHFSKAKPLLSALASFLFILMLFKAPVLFSQVKYLLASHTSEQAPAIVANNVSEAVPPNPIITIPKINVSAPIIFEPSFDEAKIERALQDGVVHYGTTPFPGKPGNSVIVGHSSNDWWQPGNYKFVFVLLDKLVVGDTFSVNYNSKRYIYEVTNSRVVEATDLSVLAATPDPTITIITCWPAGTSLKREIIQAKQISPQPTSSGQVVTTTPTSPTVLPGSAPSFLDQIKQFLQGIRDSISNKPATVTEPSPSTTATPTTSTTTQAPSGSLPSGL